jgi:transcriptional regulator with XRE-family HTH domain
MKKDEQFNAEQLASLAKRFRKAAGKSKADVARELGVAAPTVFSAEERPEMSLSLLRIRIIEKYSKFKVTGPAYFLKHK